MLIVLGRRIALIYKKRIDFWNEMHQMSEFFGNEIRFTADSPHKILLRFAIVGTTDRWHNVNCQPETFFSCFSDNTKAVAQELRLKPEEQQLLLAFAGGLGTTDIEGQINHCGNYSQLFLTQATRAANEYAAKGKMYRSLGWLSAAAFVVMIG